MSNPYQLPPLNLHALSKKKMSLGPPSGDIVNIRLSDVDFVKSNKIKVKKKRKLAPLGTGSGLAPPEKKLRSLYELEGLRKHRDLPQGGPGAAAGDDGRKRKKKKKMPIDIHR